MRKKKGKRKNDLVIYEEIFVTFGRIITKSKSTARVPRQKHGALITVGPLGD